MKKIVSSPELETPIYQAIPNPDASGPRQNTTQDSRALASSNPHITIIPRELNIAPVMHAKDIDNSDSALQILKYMIRHSSSLINSTAKIEAVDRALKENGVYDGQSNLSCLTKFLSENKITYERDPYASPSYQIFVMIAIPRIKLLLEMYLHAGWSKPLTK
jgi:hypothetical protein